MSNLGFFQRTKVLLKEKKEHWYTIAKPTNNFDLILMKVIGSEKNAYHVGLWTKANGGAVVHAVSGGCIDLDSLREIKMRGFEIKRFMRHN